MEETTITTTTIIIIEIPTTAIITPEIINKEILEGGIITQISLTMGGLVSIPKMLTNKIIITTTTHLGPIDT